MKAGVPSGWALIHALGTSQRVFIRFCGGVASPQAPIAGSMRIDGTGACMTVPLEVLDHGVLNSRRSCA